MDVRSSYKQRTEESKQDKVHILNLPYQMLSLYRSLANSPTHKVSSPRRKEAQKYQGIDIANLAHIRFNCIKELRQRHPKLFEA
jgi:hypothetical protein